jgi:hypothetical protein
MALLLALTASCSDPSSTQAPVERSAKSWVGSVEGSDVAVGVVFAEQRAVLFFCGGDSSYELSTHWFSSALPKSAPFSISDGPWRVSGEEQESGFSGTVENADAIQAFNANPVAPGTSAGLYDARSPCGHVGLIVRQDSASDEPAAQGTCLDVIAGKVVVEQVNPVVPLARDEESGILVTVPATDEQVIVHPLAPAAG